MKSEQSQVHNQAHRRARGEHQGHEFWSPAGGATAPDPYGWQGADSMPSVPALFATRLQLELLLQDPVIDLRAVTEVILADLGATLEVFRLAAREREPGDEPPARIEDALAGLSLDSCLQAISRAVFAHDGRFAALAATWEHARSLAQSMRAAAEWNSSVPAEQAYLVGLLHELGQLPALLGWPGAVTLDGRGASRSRQPSGALLAESWGLPSFLVEALGDIESRRRGSPWVSLLSAAHGRAEGTEEARRSASPAQTLPRVQASAPARKSRVLSFASFEQQQWKARAGAPLEGLPVRAPMRPPA